MTESDPLLMEYLEPREDSAVDAENQRMRADKRHPSLFGLYPLPAKGDAIENRSHALPPSEPQSLRLHIKVSELR